jgi:hypothetical protein
VPLKDKSIGRIKKTTSILLLAVEMIQVPATYFKAIFFSSIIFFS